MTAEGWGSATNWDWINNEGGTAMVAPASYNSELGHIISEIQRHIRELTLVDTEIQNTGSIPAKYKPFVDKYMEVLSGVGDAPQQ